MEKIDLHLHTNLSDGDLSPVELIRMCKRVGCSKIAITDHDKINDYSNLGIEYEIPIISGIEFNSDVRGMHILGYGLDNIDKVQKIMTDLEKENEAVCYKVIDALYNSGYDISVEQVLDYMKLLGISVSHLNKKHIVKYLIFKEYVKNVLDAYNNLIGVGQKFYHPIRKLSKYEILDIIKRNNGVAVLAHPSTLKMDAQSLKLEICKLIDSGLDGIEIKNRSITRLQSIKYYELATELGIITTVGSDFHSPYLDILGVEASESIYENLQKKLNKRS